MSAKIQSINNHLNIVRVFVSSTFRDMHAERDYLNRFVFPELRSRSQKHGIEFVGVDLRWGVTEDEAPLEICLNEIKKCNFFISFLGDRYGWIPPPDEIPQEFFEEVRRAETIKTENAKLLDELYMLDETAKIPVYRIRDQNIPDDLIQKLIHFWEKAGLLYAGDSITAREIFQGAFDPADPKTRAFFYFRRSGIHLHPHFPEPLVPVFKEQDPDRINKLDDLKQQIRSQTSENIKLCEFTAGYAGLRIDPTFLASDLEEKEGDVLKNGVIQPEEWSSLSDGTRAAVKTHGTVALTGMEELGQKIIQDIWSAIESEREGSMEPLDAHSQERTYHERFIVERTRFFRGRDDLLKAMRDYVLAKNDPRPLVITGPPGCGKSALMAKCARQCCKAFPDSMVLFHFIGASPGSTDITATIRSLCETLRRECNLEDELPADPEELRNILPAFLKKAGDKRSVILILDAVNQLDPAHRSHELRWLPLLLPSHVKVIVSTLEGDCFDQLKKDVPDDHFLYVPALQEPDRKNLITNYLAYRGKKFTEKQKTSLLDTHVRFDAGLPLYLLVALEELCLFGDYDTLDQRIDSLPETLPDLFDQVLGRLEMDHTRDLTGSILRRIAVSRSGLLESEILDMFSRNKVKCSRVNWTRFYRSLEFYLRPLDEITGAGLIDFYHEQLRFAVYRRYLHMLTPETSPSEPYQYSHNQLADYFRSLATDTAEPTKWRTDYPRSLNELPYHLHGSERKEELRSILLDFNWLEAKLNAVDVVALVNDFDFLLNDRNVGCVQGAIRLSAYVLASDKKQLAGQLLGRLQSVSEPDIKMMLEQACGSKVHRWLRPLTPSLMPPGGNLRQIFSTGGDSGETLAITPDGRQIVSPGAENSLSIWDLYSGERLNVLTGHSDLVRAIAITADGHCVISASEDKTLRVWDLQSGNIRRTITSSGMSALAVAVTPDGKQAICTAQEHPLGVREWRSGKTLKVLRGHTGLVRAITIPSDGRYAISTSWDQTIKIWDLQTGEAVKTLEGNGISGEALTVTPDGGLIIASSDESNLTVCDVRSGHLVKTLSGHVNLIRAIAVTPDGKRVVSASRDKTVKIWDLGSGNILKTLEEHTDEVGALAITPDGRFVVSADKTLIVWDLHSGKALRKLKGHTNAINAIAITPDGKSAVSTSIDGELNVWDLESGDQLSMLSGHTEPAWSVAITPDWKLVISADKKITVRDLKSENVLATFREDNISGSVVAVSPDGNLVVYTLEDHPLKVFDLASGQAIRTMRGHTQLVRGIAVTPDGQRVVSASWDQTLRLWDLGSGTSIMTLKGYGISGEALTLTPDGNLAIAPSDDNTITVWDLHSGEVVRSLSGHTGVVNTVAITSDGRLAVSASQDRTLKVWDLTSGQVLKTLRGHTNPASALAITPNGHLAVSASIDGTVRVWDLEHVEEELNVPGSHTDFVRAVAITPDGKLALSASDDHTLKVWDLHSGQEQKTLIGHTEEVWALAITPRGHLAISGSRDRTLKVWDLASGQLLKTLVGHNEAITAIAITPDGHQAVSASYDECLNVWDLESGELLNTLRGHNNIINTVAITPDGRLAISGSLDSTLKVWDLTSGRNLKTLTDHPDSVEAVAITPDGHLAVSGGLNDNSLRLWDLQSGKGLGAVKGSFNSINSIVITSDGYLAVCAADDTWNNFVDILDVSSRKEVKRLIGHTDIIEQVVISPDQRMVVSVSLDHTVTVWDLDDSEVITSTSFTADGGLVRVAIAPDGATIVAGEESGRVHFLRLEQGGRSDKK